MKRSTRSRKPQTGLVRKRQVRPFETRCLALAKAGKVEALRALVQKHESPHVDRLAYKWLCVAADFGHEDADEEIADLCEVSSLRYDDSGFERGAAHWELAVEYLVGKTLTTSLPMAEKHLGLAFEYGDLSDIRAGASDVQYDATELLLELNVGSQPRILLESYLPGGKGILYSRIHQQTEAIRTLISCRAPEVITRGTLHSLLSNVLALTHELGGELQDPQELPPRLHQVATMFAAGLGAEAEGKTLEVTLGEPHTVSTTGPGSAGPDALGEADLSFLPTGPVNILVSRGGPATEVVLMCAEPEDPLTFSRARAHVESAYSSEGERAIGSIKLTEGALEVRPKVDAVAAKASVIVHTARGFFECTTGEYQANEWDWRCTWLRLRLRSR